MDDKYLNSYEKDQGVKLNFSYILQFWKEINSIPKKIHEKKSESENPQDCHTVRALRKRLKRIQRKVRCVNAREAKANPKKQVDAKA